MRTLLVALLVGAGGFPLMAQEAPALTEEQNAVASFQSVVDRAKDAATIPPVVLELPRRGFEKQAIHVADAKWDVERTDSLVSPLRGKVKLVIRWQQAASCTQEEFERMARWTQRRVGPMPDYSCNAVRFTREQAEAREFTQVESREVLLTFSRVNGQWALSTLAMGKPPDLPSVASHEDGTGC